MCPDVHTRVGGVVSMVIDVPRRIRPPTDPSSNGCARLVHRLFEREKRNRKRRGG